MNMETINFQGAFPDGEWDFSRMYSTENHHHQNDFTSYDQFPGESGCLQFTTNHLDFSTIDPELSNETENLFCSWNSLINPDFQFASQENSSSSNCSTSVFAPNSESYFLSDSMSMDFCIVDEENAKSFFPVIPEISMTEAVSVTENLTHSDNCSSLPPKELQLKRKFDTPESEVNPSDGTAKKKTRVTRDVMKSKKNEKAKKNSSPKNKKEEEEINGGEEGHSSSSCSSEEDNASREALNSSGKARASRGSATDPQSLYARKRRERINERLRILQNLVPNGTKVDISTMLEEAVQYVKFLQLQIKLLSSDDMWMYAPIAYNGMDIGLNQKISMLL